MPEPELWTATEAAAHIGAASAAAARKMLSRWGVTAYAYRRSSNGRPQAVYAADRVRSELAARPGQGARTDLRKP